MTDVHASTAAGDVSVRHCRHGVVCAPVSAAARTHTHAKLNAPKRKKAKVGTLMLHTTPGVSTFRGHNAFTRSCSRSVQIQNAVCARLVPLARQQCLRRREHARKPCRWHKPVLSALHTYG